MKILLLCHAFNCLTQRFQSELLGLGHQVSIEFDINDEVTLDAVEGFQPDLILAPFLKRAIPEVIWRDHLCLIVHPGIVGDRGPSSLDWAILNREQQWGVTILQASEVMDGGDIWATETFLMPTASKSRIYRNQVTEAAIKALRKVLQQLKDPTYSPEPLDYNRAEVAGRWRELMRQADRKIDWAVDSSECIVTKINSADGNPGLLDRLLGVDCYLYNACTDYSLERLKGLEGLNSAKGEIIAKRDGALCIATVDGAVWVSHLRAKPSQSTLNHSKQRTLKLPATLVLESALEAKGIEVPELPVSESKSEGFQEIWSRIEGDRAYLYFNFYNGAMSSDQCLRLRDAYLCLARMDIKAIVLMGGEDFWSNGIHLNLIEVAESPADESWRNINGMNDLTQAIIETTDIITVSAIRANAGAGGVFLALACDIVVIREGVILNPHYKGMGNLYGSEYWTYLLPKRVGQQVAEQITRQRLPMMAEEAVELGLADQSFSSERFEPELNQLLDRCLTEAEFESFIHTKRAERLRDEAEKPLAEYRAEELQQMKLNFYGFDPSYHVARYHFVYKLPKARTPSYLAMHRKISKQAS
ncbi:hydrogenase maturation protein [Motiliproteus sp. MSK22-1]|uniref:hydrogenase maturation protein n=1 Tax=Motiliproteus sp. MSK22-1 TaxID=1897630 RepID=UPI0009778603|nr:hydrogenase maturation protein [Motiliproteus sp. MSK22-1]OMH32127.1 hydrogenase maturation protein [Motiliproteus sp. MSK22-1]